MAVYFNENIRCYEDGRVERLWKKGYWKEVPNTANNIDGYNKVGEIGENKKAVFRHRLIAACFLGLNIIDLKQEVDHINRIKMDNRVENLRIVTRQQQQFNRGAKGYRLRKDTNKWEAYIALNKKTSSLGCYKTEEEARQAYLDAKAIYHTF